MKASGSTTVYNTIKDLIPSATAPPVKATGQLWLDTTNNTLYKWSGSEWVRVIAQALHTSKVAVTDEGIDLETDGALNIKSGARMNLKSGGALNVEGGTVDINAESTFKVAAGAESGEFMKIQNDSETVMFGGADDAEGTNAGFALSRNGRFDCNDAHIKGSVELTDGADFKLEDGATASFGEIARQTFITALFGGSSVSVVPCGSGIATRGELRALLGIYSGQGAPSDTVTSPLYGDIYLKLASATETPSSSASFTLSGYQREVIRHKKTVVKRLNGVTQSSSTSTTNTITGATETSSSVWSYNSGTYEYDSSSSSSTSGGVVTTTTTFKQRQTYYWAVCPAPTSAQLAASPVESSTITFTLGSNPNTNYNLYLSTGSQGKDGTRTLIAQKKIEATTVEFDLSNVIETLKGAGTTAYYFSLEPATSGAMNTARTVTTASMGVDYIGGTATNELYAYNGSAWNLI
ncbi:MAG: hypothetical protein PHN24_03155 [Eubacteriales bacterium]|nr:hypothetical protein [Eubacteriales bacterium]